MLILWSILLACVVLAHVDASQRAFYSPDKTRVDQDPGLALKKDPTYGPIYAGIASFGFVPTVDCFTTQMPFDIGFLGLPIDTATTYRPGARFGPNGIRQGSRRLRILGGYNVPLDVNPFFDWAKVVDCGDVLATPYDTALALRQIEDGHKKALHRSAATPSLQSNSHGGKTHPRIISMGGDHSVTLPVLRSMASVHGPLSVIHFDSHLDTWKPKGSKGEDSATAALNHGTYFYHASKEGLIRNGTSIHAGIRTTLYDIDDYKNDADCGFKLIEAWEIDTLGVKGIIDAIKETVKDTPTYLSIDIDVIDPSAAPATGTPETGGWTTRELRTIVRGLRGINLVGADLVEVAPAYDTAAEITQIAAADVLFEVLSLMVKKGPLNQ